MRARPTRTEIAARAFQRSRRPGLGRWLSDVRQQAAATVAAFYGLRAPTYVDFTLVTEMRPGDHTPLHADNEAYRDGAWVPNHTAYHRCTAMLYLNTSGLHFHGGHLRFPGLRREIVPQAGLLVGFLCGREYAHEVAAVRAGARYAVSMWMTEDPVRAERWPWVGPPRRHP